MQALMNFLRALGRLPGLSFLGDMADTMDAGRMRKDDFEESVEFRKKDLRNVKGSGKQMRRR